jgi:hypothetical protein
MESWHSYTDGEIRQYRYLGGVERQVYTECMGGRETELENVWKWRGTYKIHIGILTTRRDQKKGRRLGY